MVASTVALKLGESSLGSMVLCATDPPHTVRNSPPSKNICENMRLASYAVFFFSVGARHSHTLSQEKLSAAFR